MSPTVQTSAAVRRIEPAKSRVKLSDLWTTWPITRMFALRDFTLQFKQSLLGPVWLALQPLGMLGAFTVVFNGITDVGTGEVPYALFSIIGVMVYGYLQLVLATGSRTLTMNKLLVRQVACPRLPIVTSKVITALVQPAFMITLTFIALIASGWGLHWENLALPLVVGWLVLFTWALLLGVASVNVRYRDASALMPYALQAGLLVSPIAYPLSAAPSSIEWLFYLNPISGIVETWRWCFLGTPLNVAALACAVGWTIVLVFGNWRLFKRLEVGMGDVV